MSDQTKEAPATPADPLLQRLQATERAIEADEAPPAENTGAEVPAVVDEVEATAKENEALLELAHSMLEPLAPTVVKPFTLERRMRIAIALARVEIKRGFRIAAVFAGWAEELMLLSEVARPAMESVAEVRRLQAAKAAEPSAPPPERIEPIVTPQKIKPDGPPHDGVTPRELAPAA